jgi:hypothetical protein
MLFSANRSHLSPSKDRHHNLLIGNDKGANGFLGGFCGLFGDSCEHLELPRGDASEALVSFL